MTYQRGVQPSFAIYLYPLRVWAFRRWIINRKKPFSFAWLKPHFPRRRKRIPGKMKVIAASYDGLNSKFDVTEAVKTCSDGGKLSIVVNNNLAGFDPEPGCRKILSLTYLVGGRLHKAVAYEGDRLVLP